MIPIIAVALAMVRDLIRVLFRSRTSVIAENLFLINGGTIENAQAIAAHESPRTTRLYDRRQKTITRNIVERISI